jgi:hypothetical protein
MGILLERSSPFEAINRLLQTKKSDIFATSVAEVIRTDALTKLIGLIFNQLRLVD